MRASSLSIFCWDKVTEAADFSSIDWLSESISSACVVTFSSRIFTALMRDTMSACSCVISWVFLVILALPTGGFFGVLSFVCLLDGYLFRDVAVERKDSSLAREWDLFLGVDKSRSLSFVSSWSADTLIPESTGDVSCSLSCWLLLSTGSDKSGDAAQSWFLEASFDWILKPSAVFSTTIGATVGEGMSGVVSTMEESAWGAGVAVRDSSSEMGVRSWEAIWGVASKKSSSSVSVLFLSSTTFNMSFNSTNSFNSSIVALVATIMLVANMAEPPAGAPLSRVSLAAELSELSDAPPLILLFICCLSCVALSETTSGSILLTNWGLH